MLKPHKHAAIIKAWADGAEIEVKATVGSDWLSCPSPMWWKDQDYRVKPEKKPDVVELREISLEDGYLINRNKTPRNNVKYTFDGETGKLKAVELI